MLVLTGDFVTYGEQLYYRLILDGYYILYRVVDGIVDFSHYWLEHRFVYEHYTGLNLTSDIAIHHINHNKLDNRIENLEAMSKSEHARRHAKELGKRIGGNYCIDCGTPVSQHAKRCKACSYKHLGRTGGPPREILAELIEHESNSAIARIYGVSDSAVKKWRRKHGLPSANEQHGTHRGGNRK